MGYVHQDPGEESAPQRRFQPTGHQITSAVLIALVLIFALVNLHTVGIDFVVTSVRMPLFFVIVGSMGIGVAAGALIRHHREQHHEDHHHEDKDD